MKHIKTFAQLRESVVNEAVSVDTIRYKRSHGKEPKGTGLWAFYFNRTGGDPIFAPTTMSYSDAVKWAKEEAKKAGKSVVYVGESVETLTEENMMLSNISDVDHTRIVKWMGQYYDYPKQYDIKRKGKDLEITIKKMSSQEIDDLKDYLKSQKYINEAYSGNMSDFKYDLEMAIEELGIYSNAIKKVSKSGKGYEVRMSSYMSQRGTWEKIGELIGATLVDFKADPKSINVGIYERENVITEGFALIFDIVEPEFNDLKGKLNDLNKKTIDLKWRKALDQIQREVEKLEFFISKYDRQLGAIETNESLNEREYSDEERKDMADKGLALPDGSFPIKDLEDLKNAIQAYGRSKDQSATAKFIVKRAKALSAEDLIPDTEDFQKALKETITEGNAFLAARAKAIEEDSEEFEFNGKKYPVLNRPKKLNESTSLKDAIAILKKENIMAYPNPEDLAKAIHKHYKEITGNKYKDAVEMSMDDKIADIVSYFKIDGSDFMSAWDKTIKD